MLRSPVAGIAAVFLALGVLAAGWYLLSPLFLNRTVSEAFPLSARAELPAGMSRETAEQEMVAAAGQQKNVAEPMPAAPAQPALAAEGSFKDGDSFHKGEGVAKLYRLPDGGRLLRFEQFRVTNGPELHVLVTGHPDPKTRADLEQARYHDLGRLKGNIGDQNYTVPASIDSGSLKTVVIYCLPFHVVFSTAALGGT